MLMSNRYKKKSVLRFYILLKSVLRFYILLKSVLRFFILLKSVLRFFILLKFKGKKTKKSPGKIQGITFF